MKKVGLIFLLILFVLNPALSKKFDERRVSEWVDSVFLKMTVNERLGQLVDLKIQPDENNVSSLIQFIRENHIGAVTITGGDPEVCVRLINEVNAGARIPLMVSNGNTKDIGLPFDDFYKIPGWATISATRDPEIYTSLARETANQLEVMGVKSDSYGLFDLVCMGTQLKLVAGDGDHNVCHDFLNSMAREYSERGIMANINLSFDLSPEAPFSSNKMMGNYLVDWKACYERIKDTWNNFNDPLTSVTITSIPNIVPEEANGFRKKTIEPLLWKTLNFQGLVIGDIESMVANIHGGTDQGTVWSALKIGCDVVRVNSDPGEVVDMLEAGIEKGYFRHNEFVSKIKRILMAKYIAGFDHNQKVNEDHIYLKVNNPSFQSALYRTYQKAIHVIEGNTDLLPFSRLDTTNFASLTIGSDNLKTFQVTLEKYAPFVHYNLPHGSYSAFDLHQLESEIKYFDNVVIGIYVNDEEPLEEPVISFIRKLKESSNVIVSFFGEAPENELDELDVRIFAHEDNAYTQLIVPQFIFGALENDALKNYRLTYSIPEMQGMDSRILDGINDIVDEGIKNRAMPGCQILVARNGSVIYEKGFGYYTYDSIMPVDTRTIYDLASVTKVAATTQMIMYLSDQGKLNLDDTLGTYIPELSGTNKGGLKIRDILAHQSGLKSFVPFWRYTIEDTNFEKYYHDEPDKEYASEVAFGMFANNLLKDSLWVWTLETDLRRKGRNKDTYDYKYSDLGFYLMQVLAERLTGQSMDEFLDTYFYKPLGASTIGFNPMCRFPIKRMPPTARDDRFRNMLIWGTVHDEIAAMNGGVAGHAGLFSNSHDLAKLLQMGLQGGEYGGVKFLNEGVINEFTSSQSKENRRGLGWDKPDKNEEHNPASRYASYKTFGHRGFTGTVVWADPTFNLIFVFLSNRIYPDAGNTKLANLNIRKRIQDKVYESIWSFEKQYN